MSQPHPAVAPATAPVPEVLLSLAPLGLPNLRRTRYQGEDLHVPIDAFTPSDQAILRELYAAFTRLLGRMVPGAGQPGVRSGCAGA